MNLRACLRLERHSRAPKWLFRILPFGRGRLKKGRTFEGNKEADTTRTLREREREKGGGQCLKCERGHHLLGARAALGMAKTQNRTSELYVASSLDRFFIFGP